MLHTMSRRRDGVVHGLGERLELGEEVAIDVVSSSVNGHDHRVTRTRFDERRIKGAFRGRTPA